MGEVWAGGCRLASGALDVPADRAGLCSRGWGECIWLNNGLFPAHMMNTLTTLPSKQNAKSTRHWPLCVCVCGERSGCSLGSSEAELCQLDWLNSLYPILNTILMCPIPLIPSSSLYESQMTLSLTIACPFLSWTLVAGQGVDRLPLDSNPLAYVRLDLQKIWSTTHTPRKWCETGNTCLCGKA